MVECENKEGVTALREISSDKVRFKENVDEITVGFIEEQRRQLQVTTGEHTFLEAASLRALEDEDADDEEETADVEELQSDPEALNKQASKSSDDSDDDDDDSDSDGEESDSEEFDADDALDGDISEGEDDKSSDS